MPRKSIHTWINYECGDIIPPHGGETSATFPGNRFPHRSWPNSLLACKHPKASLLGKKTCLLEPVSFSCISLESLLEVVLQSSGSKPIPSHVLATFLRVFFLLAFSMSEASGAVVPEGLGSRYGNLKSKTDAPQYYSPFPPTLAEGGRRTNSNLHLLRLGWALVASNAFLLSRKYK